MGIFDRLFGRKSSSVIAPVKTREEIQAGCAHAALMGRWNSAEDMGKDDKVSEFVCDACQASFTPEAGRQLRATTAARMHVEDVERARQRAEKAD